MEDAEVDIGKPGLQYKCKVDKGKVGISSGNAKFRKGIAEVYNDTAK